MRQRRIAFAVVLSIAFPLAARGADRQLDEAKHAHDVAVARADAPETDTLQLRTTEFGSVKVYLDGKLVLEHQADKKKKYQATLPLALSGGAHIIVIRHANDWAGDYVGVRLLGHNLQMANLLVQ